ncbi:MULTISPECIES: hypothetical protein [unclassified Thermoactinomyces]|uniref:hypothetical protein n=1 Tax=unclassified Thermoactinomyces TaxID=2634588 RepID=UPI0018DB1F31|nr:MULTISPECIES: hypothetical protein [unclassified Thermoactinomyces]MBH8599053.1 hypothetical protein [Thermoactinomyces sp. CICC 10523]MBH8608016.1 hypothetical protein [Thermoactinomyces sp. CICC 10521]
MESSLSLKLQKIATQAFYDYVLPMIRRDFPQIEKRFLVNITSSVAYGVADQYSDLDMFIIFEHHRDYEKFAEPLEQAINQIKFPQEFYSVCDKGIRFELESLRRSDISKIFHCSDNDVAWMYQTDWLIHWFLNAITIYDPAKLAERFKQRCFFYPKHILESKIYFSILSMWTDYYLLKKKNHVFSYYSLRLLFRILSRTLDIYYWRNGSYTPHPKWKYRLATLLKKQYRHNPILWYIDQVLEAILKRDFVNCLNKIEWLIEYLENEIDSRSNNQGISVLEKGLVKIESDQRVIYLIEDTVINKKRFKELKSLIFAGKRLLYPTEIGYFHFKRPGYNYDIAMRISDRFRYLMNKQNHQIPHYMIDENNNIQRKRFRYYNFIVWRKIRVVEKALKRNDKFLYIWYSIQVIDYLLEIAFRLVNDFMPMEEISGESILHLYSRTNSYLWDIVSENEFANIVLNEPGKFIQLCWETFRHFQSIFLQKGFITQKEAEWPLDTQFEIEYWKYENLFL